MPVLIGPASDECPNCPTCLHETVNTEMQWIPGPESKMSSSFPGLPHAAIFFYYQKELGKACQMSVYKIVMTKGYPC